MYGIDIQVSAIRDYKDYIGLRETRYIGDEDAANRVCNSTSRLLSDSVGRSSQAENGKFRVAVVLLKIEKNSREPENAFDVVVPTQTRAFELYETLSNHLRACERGIEFEPQSQDVSRSGGR